MAAHGQWGSAEEFWINGDGTGCKYFSAIRTSVIDPTDIYCLESVLIVTIFLMNLRPCTEHSSNASHHPKKLPLPLRCS